MQVPSPCGRGRGCTCIEFGESPALFSLSSDEGGGEGRGEESRFYWISPLPNPLPARSSRGEGDRRSTFECLIQRRWGKGDGEGGLQLSGTQRIAWRGALFSFAQNSQLHRQFANALVCGALLPPHPGPLPEERENSTRRFRRSGAARLVAARGALFPLPAGEPG
jgi:hypothetical protein